MNSMPTMRFSHPAMACDFEVILSGDDPAYARRAANAAFVEIDRLEQELSRFIPTSDISRINAAPLHRATRVGSAAMECLQLAQRFYDQTHGAFDVTIGHFLSPTTHDRPIGMKHLHIDVAARGVMRIEDVCIDLGAIGKGYALDQIVPVLRDWGFESMLLHAGQSTVLAAGDEGSVVHLRDPQNHNEVLEPVMLWNQSLSGSGRHLHGAHIINPRTGAAATDYLASWAIAPTAAESDALSTALMVMTREQIASLIGEAPELCAAVMGVARQVERWGAWPGR